MIGFKWKWRCELCVESEGGEFNYSYVMFDFDFDKEFFDDFDYDGMFFVKVC